MLNTEYRLYDPRLAQWLTRDPVFQPWESPYSAMAGNPILFSDPQGDTPGTDGANGHTNQNVAPDGGGTTQTNPQALTEQNGNTITVGSNGALTTTGASGMKTDKKTNTSSTKSATVSSVTSSESTLIIHADPQGALSAGKESVSTDKKEISPLPFMENDKRIISDQTSAKVNDFYFPDDICEDCVHPATVGHNLFYKIYPGGNNAKTYGGEDTFEPEFKSVVDVPGFMHDQRYQNLGIEGGLGLLFAPEAIGADIVFVMDNLAIANDDRNDFITRTEARVLGLGLGLLASFKTAFTWTVLTITNAPYGGHGLSFERYVAINFIISNTNPKTGEKVNSRTIKHIHDPINKPWPKK